MFKTIKEIKDANEEVGRYFFEKDTMRFFRSIIETRKPIAGSYFITSEQFDNNSPRLYTIRQAESDGGINTIGDFQEYKTKEDAKKAINELTKGE